MTASRNIGQMLCTVLAFVAYGGAFWLALQFKNETMLNVLATAAVSLVTTAVGFWLGSSSGSQRKDEFLRPGGEPSNNVPVDAKARQIP